MKTTLFPQSLFGSLFGKNIIPFLLLVLTALTSLFAHAEDIDIFRTPVSSGSGTNVLIIFDNNPGAVTPALKNCPASCTCSNFLEAQKCVLKQVIDKLNDKVSVGLMIFNTGNVKGGKILSAVKPMTASNKTALKGQIDKIDKSGGSNKYASAFQEAYLYFAGGQPFKGLGELIGNSFNNSITITNYVDPGAFKTPVPTIQKVGNKYKLEHDNWEDYRYLPPTADATCGTDNYIIFIGQSTPDSNEANELQKFLEKDYPGNYPSNLPSKTDMMAIKKDGNLVGTDLINLMASIVGPYSDTNIIDLPTSPKGSDFFENSWLDEYARILRHPPKTDFLVSTESAAPPISTYTLQIYDQKDVDKGIASTMGAIGLMKSTAAQGEGEYAGVAISENFLDDFTDALTQFFIKVSAIDTVFASSTLPLNSNTENRGLYLNQVYMGVFRPDVKWRPLWDGNIKLYKLIRDPVDNQTVVLGDSQSPSQRADNPSLGFMKKTAISYWTYRHGSEDTSFNTLIATSASTTTEQVKNVNDKKLWWKGYDNTLIPDPDKGFWQFRYQATDLDLNAGYDRPDGYLVEKGGAAEQLRYQYMQNFSAKPSEGPAKKIGHAADQYVPDPNNRPAYTCASTSTCPSDLKNGRFADKDDISSGVFQCSDTATQSLLGYPGSEANCNNFIRWTLGENNNAEASGSMLANDIRPNIHGDILHSRPAVVNYGSKGIMVYYGANDGMLHAIKGGQDPTDPSESGFEKWTFIPPDLFASMNLLREGWPSGTDVTTVKRAYFVDGPIGVLREPETEEATMVHLFLGLRRGGRSLYAIDASNTLDSTNATPKFLWNVYCNASGCTRCAASSCSSDEKYLELGQTWSLPSSAKIQFGGATKTVLIFGMGYDPAHDDAVPPGGGTTPARSMGRGVLVVDASDGSVIWQVRASSCGTLASCVSKTEMGSVPSDIRVLDTDKDKFVDRLYFGDTEGHVWRVNIDGTKADNNWGNVKLLASVPGATATPREFLYAPDVILKRNEDTTRNYDAILIGSGDRENPKDTSIQDGFFMFKDMNSDPIQFDDLYSIARDSATIDQSALDSKKGWYLPFESGEKATGGSVTLAGTTIFGTYRYDSATAESEVKRCTAYVGTGALYAVNYKTGLAATNIKKSTNNETTAAGRETLLGEQIGMPPAPVVVSVKLPGEDKITLVGIMGPVVVSYTPEPLATTGEKTYWYMEVDTSN